MVKMVAIGAGLAVLAWLLTRPARVEDSRFTAVAGIRG
jgi:hypothetical protein